MKIVFNHPDKDESISIATWFSMGKLWISRQDGEGMEINESDFYFMLDKWFSETM